MAVSVKFFIFAYGNVVRGEEGASYDRDPSRKIRLKTDASYTDLLNAICTGVRIDPTTHQIKVHHRHPNKSVEGRVHYSLVPILDDDDLKDLIEMAENMGEGSIQELYVEISDRSIALSEHETQQVVVTKPSTSQIPRSKRDPIIDIEDFTPKRARYEMHLSIDINNMEQEISCVPENPLIETSKNLIVADLRNEDPSENLMIDKFHDPTAFPLPPSSFSMDIANEMEDGNQPSRASSSTTPPHGQDYEVFLSFRGKDTRYGFTDHLYNGLVNAGVLVFRDDNELPVGEEIGPDLLKAIKGSRISIIIISENYASSAWCLDELVQILECRKTSCQIVLPILYKVEPSEVRNQTGNFGKGFLESTKRHYGKESLIQKWKNALGEVTSLKVWESSKIANGHEGELLKMVLGKVLQVLNKVALPICDHLVGVEHHVEKIIEWTSNSKQSCNAQAILIHGMGGIGKTTLAKVVYNQLCDHFERCSFIADIRATSQQNKGLEGLQKQLILNILGQELYISNIDEGSNIIKARCNRKKVLMLLDDIDHRHQLNALAREPDWFGRGTVIIITSRRKDVLEKWEDSFSYELIELNLDQSFMLFCKHAFKRSDSIPDEYNSIAKEIVSTTGGLPLAIEVIGSLLYHKEKSFWEGNLKILKEIPHHEVQIKLKISFDALEQEEKEIFLDIACLEIYDKDDREAAFHMWDSCGFCPQVRIKNLISLSLIKNGENGELIIHDQLRDLGMEIIRQESIDDPGQRSRIWKEEDALEVLVLKKGTRNIQNLELRGHFMKPVRCTSKQFKRMTKLRYLRMFWVDLEGDFKNLFQNLRWLYWGDSELDFMGSNFIPKKLVVLELFMVNIIEQWMGWSQMKHLRVLKLECCDELITLPDISALKELEVLILRDCSNLRNIHPSIGKLKLLIVLDFCGTKVTRVPDSIGDLCNLELLELAPTPIRCLPTSIRMLSKLQKLDLSRCDLLEWLPYLPNSLTSLGFSGKLNKTLPDFSNLTNLEHLQFTHDFRRRDTTLNFRNLNRITTLRLGSNDVYADSSNTEYCDWYLLADRFDEGFKSVHINLLVELPSTLVKLELKNCYTLRILPNFSDLKNLTVLSIENCPELMKIDGLDGAESLTSVMISSCEKLSKLGGIGISVTDLGLTDLDSLVSLPNLSTAKKMKNLRIRNCRNLIEIQGLDNTKGIESVIMDRCSSIERICDLSHMKMLKTLEVHYCEKLLEIRGIGISMMYLKLEQIDSLVSLPDLSTAKKLKNLRLRNCRNLVEIQGLDNVESIESVEIVGCSSLERIGNLSHLKMLSMLELCYCKKLSNVEGIEKLTSLTSLSFIGCHPEIKFPNLSSAKKLKKLRIHGCRNLVEIQGLDNVKSIEGVEIVGCSSLERIDNLSHLKMLTTLGLGYCENLSEIRGMGVSMMNLRLEHLGSLVSLPDLSTTKKLKNLRIHSCRNLVEIQGLDNVESIESVEIIGCSSLERIGNLSPLKMLSILMLCNCTKLSNVEGIEKLTSLTSLSFIGCHPEIKFPDLSSAKKLKNLRIHGCRNLVEIQGLDNVESIEGVEIIGCSSLERIGNLSHLKMLTTLGLGYCEKLSEIRGMGVSVMNLRLEHLGSLVSLPDLSTVKKLKNLRIHSCRNLVEIQGLDNVESIESVEIIGCSSLERIRHLSHLKLLSTLEFSYCEKLSEIGEMGISVINLSTAKKLKNLRLCSCRNLVEIQGLNNAKEIECVVINGCSSLERIGSLSNLKMLSMLELCYCEKLSNVQGIEKLTSLTSLSLIGCHPEIKFPDLSMLGKLKNLRAKFPDHQNVHIIAEPLEKQGGEYLPDLS